MAQQTDNPLDENGYPVYGTFRQPTKQQSAVEWLFMTLALTPMTDWYNVLEQAKSMEKEQIINAYGDGQENGIECNKKLSNGDDCNIITALEYYNETYNK